MSVTQTNPANDRRTLTQAGYEVGDSNVTLNRNTSGTFSPVIAWECPRKFSRIDYAAGVHPTFFVPRTLETDTGDGTTSTFALNTNLISSGGETDLSKQWEEVVVVYDSTNGTEIDVESVNYGADEVTLASQPNTNADELKFYPIMGDGNVQYRGQDQFDHGIGSADEWGTPIQDFTDHDQRKSDGAIHLIGQVTWREAEELELWMDAPQELIWEEPDFPRGAYVSRIEQKVDVTV
jgi:hypothetical protein